MSKVHYIGRSTKLCGKRVFEILAHLKNFGVGRMLAKNSLDKYPEPSYYIVKQVEPMMDEELIFGQMWVEEVYRGIRLPEIQTIRNVYDPDFRLIPKDEEEAHKKGFEIVDRDKTRAKVLPRYYSVPPLMRKFLVRHQKEKQDPVADESDFKVPYVYTGHEKYYKYRVAEEGEQPDAEFALKMKIQPRFLKGVQDI